MWHTPRFRRRSTVFRLERLEDRTVLSPLIVTSDADTGPGSLRDTIATAPSGSVIEFADNVHNITLMSGELGITQDLDIEGPGPGLLTIDGNLASRVFDISGGVTVTIAGLTIADGLALAVGTDAAQGGGAIQNVSSSLTLANDVLSNNQVLSDPGGIALGGAIANATPARPGNGRQRSAQPSRQSRARAGQARQQAPPLWDQ